jgi:hypothetical protein
MSNFRIVTNDGKLGRSHWKIDIHGRDLRDGGTEVSIKDLVEFLTKEGFVTPVDPPPKEKVVTREREITPGDELYWGIARRE